MVYLVVFGILLFDFVVLKMASRCSRVEEKMYVEEFKKDIEI